MTDVPFRVGHGYDLHRLEPLAPAGRGRAMILGGVAFDAPVREGTPVGPVGHSDADVLLHAITDALLGAIAAPDIGQLFPDTDPRHEGRDSAEFLREALARVAAAGWSIVNLDATLIAQGPKLGPRKDEVRAHVARLLGVEAARVNLKGKTHERVDAVGRLEAIEAHAVVLLSRLP
jgi:2-C-methyl-D-erythritol 2,4-cyclodiphosphate synthase